MVRLGMIEAQAEDVRTLSSFGDGEFRLLLGDVDDEVASYRRREAAWISVVFHALVIVLLALTPKFMGSSAVVVPIQEKPEATFLTLPPDQLKIKEPPKTDIMSDQNRIAQSRAPQVNKETLRKLIDARKAGARGAQTPPPAAGQEALRNPVPQPQEPPAQQEQVPQPQQSTQTAKLQAPAPPRPQEHPFTMSSPGSSLDQAIHSVASGHTPARVGYGGDYGSGLRPKVDRQGPVEILSDTLGVDFGPYMRRLHETVQDHWDPLIPEVAYPPAMKKGVVVLEFVILKDGSVQGLKLAVSSGDDALDRAAVNAINYANPLPRLPVQFAGDFLKLRARFYYNPDARDMQ